jgi:hypothetical protein
MTQEEWNEMDTLRKAINDYPASVHPSKMERFTELFVMSLEGKGNYVCNGQFKN